MGIKAAEGAARASDAEAAAWNRTRVLRGWSPEQALRRPGAARAALASLGARLLGEVFGEGALAELRAAAGRAGG